MQHVSTRQHWIDTPEGALFAQSWNSDEAYNPPIILLHDSLGCVALWRDFPERLARATGRKVIAYDRLGFGRSAPYPGKLPGSFIADEARSGFRAVCEHFDVNRFVVLGHSVGGGMAVSCAAAFPGRCQGVITESAQAFVEQATCDGIREAERQFALPGQMERLHKYHGDKAYWVLRAWVDTWLSDTFSDWRLDELLQQVRCPVLVLHGDRDEYGSTRQPERIAARVSGPASVQILANCGHVPHREFADAVLEVLCTFPPLRNRDT
ncbi:alpha/beta fold hydrolase [Pseudomonas koreensis]|uniref:Alpha/beta hydrolase n=1 Tax=Pseudomonas koreensis TaxID=198620 RepID=A0A9X2XKT5_9PSED|nr:alpha/beta hydrolase [Pseudomonas koreensis]MCU7250347.1 alpha/beta hydrolase [Pseudomonas koreensis]